MILENLIQQYDVNLNWFPSPPLNSSVLDFSLTFLIKTSNWAFETKIVHKSTYTKIRTKFFIWGIGIIWQT